MLLRWLIAPLAQAGISWLMLSGFLSAGLDEAAQMASLDREIREYGKLPPEAGLDEISSYQPRTGSPESRQFLFRLRNLRRGENAAGVEQRTATFGAWLNFAGTVLRQAGWPGARTLESVEFQALARWSRLTEDVAALGFDSSRIDYKGFVTMLDRYATETIFSPESSQAQVQIMGALEAAGQQFDALWFLGVDDRQWPALAQPHPLLPLSIQRNSGMPHSSVNADWQLALTVTQRIAASATAVVFSHAQRDDSGELRLSPLLGVAFELPLSTLSSEELRRQLDAPVPSEHRLETVLVEDSSSISWPREIAAGGSEILKRQSACGFQSFATRRLGARKLHAAERGLSALDRGEVLHGVLQALWSSNGSSEWQLHTRDDLRDAKSSGRLDSIVDHHIRNAFAARKGRSKETAWTSTYLQVEQARLKSRLLRWLDYEAVREPFTVVQIEEAFQTHIGDLQLNLRVDRVDRVADGHLILDYKTGKVSPGMWQGERPEEPQLPLYAVFGGVDDLRGVLFAQIRAGETGFTGHAENLAGGASITSLDEEMLGGWSDALSVLADRFLFGHADIAPKSYPRTCTYCELGTLCRVAETALVLEVENAEDLESQDYETKTDLTRGEQAE